MSTSPETPSSKRTSPKLSSKTTLNAAELLSDAAEPEVLNETDSDVPEQLKILLRQTQASAEKPLFAVKEEIIEDEEEANEHGIEFRSGETKGPYPARAVPPTTAQSTDPQKFVISLCDPMGGAYKFEVESDDHEFLARIRACANPHEANAILSHIENGLQVLITKDVRNGDSILATYLPQAEDNHDKKLLCELCGVARFNAVENLAAHQKFYCRRQEPRVVFRTNVPCGSVQPQNVIYLPVAFHDGHGDLIQMLGPPQTIVPVAIALPRNNASICNPLLLQRSMAAGLAQTPPNAIGFLVGDVNVTVPLAAVDGPAPPPPPLQITRKRVHERDAAVPLDLSKRPRERNSPNVPPPMAPPPPPPPQEKAFSCDCGVSFNVEETLNAHKRYYCRLNAEQAEKGEVTKKNVSRCHQCGFEAQSASQLSVHMRTVHSAVQAYICRICGYRGYSIRGIRGHMRSHAELDEMKFDTYLATQVTLVKTEQAPEE